MHFIMCYRIQNTNDKWDRLLRDSQLGILLKKILMWAIVQIINNNKRETTSVYRQGRYEALFMSTEIIFSIVIYISTEAEGPWSYGSRIYNNMCNQCLSSLKFGVPIPQIAYSIQMYVIKFVCDLRQAVVFYGFLIPIKLPTNIQLKYC